MALLKVSVLMDDFNSHPLRDVLEHARRAGLEVDRVLESIGVVTGSVDSSHLKALKEVSGVLTVEKQGQFQIAPPTSDIQ